MYDNFFKRNVEIFSNYRNRSIYPHAMMLSDSLEYLFIFEENRSVIFLVPRHITDEQFDYFESHYYSLKGIDHVAITKNRKEAIFEADFKIVNGVEDIYQLFLDKQKESERKNEKFR